MGACLLVDFVIFDCEFIFVGIISEGVLWDLGRGFVSLGRFPIVFARYLGAPQTWVHFKWSSRLSFLGHTDSVISSPEPCVWPIWVFWNLRGQFFVVVLFFQPRSRAKVSFVLAIAGQALFWFTVFLRWIPALCKWVSNLASCLSQWLHSNSFTSLISALAS